VRVEEVVGGCRGGELQRAAVRAQGGGLLRLLLLLLGG